MTRPSGAPDDLLGSAAVRGPVSGSVVSANDRAGTVLIKVVAPFGANTYRPGEELLLTRANTADLIHRVMAMSLERSGAYRSIPLSYSDVLREFWSGNLQAEQPVARIECAASDSVEEDELLVLANEMLARLNSEVRDLTEELKSVLDRLDQQAASEEEPRGSRADG